MPVLAQEFKILNHESFDAALTPSMRANGGNSAANRATPDASFNAYGRRFDLNLWSNARVLRGLSRAQQARLDDFELLAGELAGIPGSWVRLTRVGDSVTGAIWDGNELYGIETRRNVQRFLLNPDSGEDTIIYRLSDTTGGGTDILIRAHAGIVDDSSKSAATTAALQKILQGAVFPALQLELGVVADEDYGNQNADPTDERLLAIVNVVDGIFLWQVGVQVDVGEMNIFNSGAGPLTSDDPETLLTQFGSYKFSTPALAAMDLAHFFTGRTLAGSGEGGSSIVGIANLASVCNAQNGVALTQATFSALNNALIATHEIAHNFGAPHDGEAGSPCEAAPEQLMSPILNGSDEFSQCSIDEMLPVIESAGCLGLVPQDDTQISVTGVPEFMGQGDRFWSTFSVDSTGPNDSLAVGVSVTTSDMDIVSSDYGTGWSCEDTNTTVECTRDLVAAGQSESFDLRLRRNSSAPGQIDVTLYAANDSNTSNNMLTLIVDPLPNVSLQTEFSPENEVLRNGDIQVFTATITNSGMDAADSLEFTGNTDASLELLSATPSTGSCSIQHPGVYEFDCTLDGLSPAASATVDLQIRGDYTAPTEPPDEPAYDSVDIASWARGNVSGQLVHEMYRSLAVTVTERTVGLYQTFSGPSQMNTGDSAIFTGEVENLGPDDARTASIIVDYNNSSVLQITNLSSNLGSCEDDPVASSFSCTVDELLSGQTLVVDATAKALLPQGFAFTIYHTSREWELPSGGGNNFHIVSIDDAVPEPQYLTQITDARHHLYDLGDINGNGKTDLAALLLDKDANRNRLFVLDGGSGALLDEVPFGTDDAEDYVLVDDITGDQVPEPVVQYQHRARTKNHVDDALLGNVPFDQNFEKERAFLSVGDTDGNSIPDIAMVAQDNDTGWVRAQVKNATTGELVSRIPFDPNYSLIAAIVLDNIADSPAREIAVFGVRDDGVYRAQVKDSLTGNVISRVYFDKRYSFEQFIALPDSTGALTYMGVLGRYGDVLRAQIKRAIDGSLVSLVRFDQDYAPVALLAFPDSNGSGGGELAMVGRIGVSSSVIAQVKEIEDATPLGIIQFSTQYEPVAAAAVNGVAGTGRSEIAVVGYQSPSTIRLQIRDLLTGSQVNNIPIP